MDKREYPRLGETVFRRTLPNGLEVLVDRRPGFRRKFAFFATRYGGMDLRFRADGAWHDTPAGVAHFLEHKLFDTQDGNALQRMAGLGANPNAFTSFSMTGYYFQCTEHFEENLRTLLDFVSKPWFTAESVQKEQGIIGQEIAMGEDDPDDGVFYDLLDCLYARPAVKHRIVGTADSIARITPETLYLCHRAFYDPGNMALVVVGDLDPDRVADIAREVVTAPGSVPPERDYGGEEPEKPVRARASRSMAVAEPLFYLGFKLPLPADGREALRVKLLGDLAGDVLLGESSPLYETLYGQGLINRGFFNETICYPQCVFFVAGGESRDPEAVREAILEEAARVAREGVPEERFRRLKRAAYGDLVSGLNSFEGTAIDLAQWHFSGAEYLEFPQVFEGLQPRDAAGFIAQWLTEDRAAMAVITPGGEGE